MTPEELESLKSYLGEDAYTTAVILQVFGNLKKYLTFRNNSELVSAIATINSIINETPAPSSAASNASSAASNASSAASNASSAASLQQ